MTIQTIELAGCRVDVLAHYLKALGIFRLVAQQADDEVRGFWRDSRFMLVTRLNEAELSEFFLQRYSPSPLVAPWNGGSGFFPKDNKAAVNAILGSSAPRFASYRSVLSRAVEATKALRESPKEDEKRGLISNIRAQWPDEALPWLDAALSLTDDSVRYPALLGTGGNDGRLDFTNNFMQRLVELFDPATGNAGPAAKNLLGNALFGRATASLERDLAIGQFLPGAAGGANATRGFDGDSLINPWDFILALEGAIAFQVAAVRRLDSQQLAQAAAPFAVRGAGAGYASATAADESARGEQWLPVWEAPAGWPAFFRLVSEARLLSGRDRATTALDAALALSQTGVARGLSSFQRFGFIERNGQANLAVPLGTWTVSLRPTASLVELVEGWTSAFQRAAGQSGAPASAGRSARRLQAAMLNVLAQPVADRVEHLLLRLAEAEDFAIRRGKWAAEQRLRPLPEIPEAVIANALPMDTQEWEVARALAALEGPASSTLRWNCVPLSSSNSSFDAGANGVRLTPSHVWRGEDLVRNLCAVGVRRLIDAHSLGWPFASARFSVRLETVTAFLEGHLDERLVAARTRALMCVKWSSRQHPPSTDWALDTAYAACRLAWSERPLVPDATADGLVFKLLARGKGRDALNAALRRLGAWGYRSRVDARRHAIALPPGAARRLAAALLLPVSNRDLSALDHSLRRQTEVSASA
ncbi:MAG: type I-U CRISPR-associated protein Csx17 [Myxococcaceae bacterium]|nr:type I-U CRISPR-associated protein Csx17 [Myxococcaceae bacterium]